MDKTLTLEKIQQAVQLLNEYNVDLWLIFVRESTLVNDPCLDIVVGTHCTWQSAFMINRNGDTTAIVGSLEEPKYKLLGTFKNVVGYVHSAKEPIIEYLQKHDPKTIAINYSIDSSLADGLTHGMYLTLCGYLKGLPYLTRLVSSEKIISSLRGRKSHQEIEYIKEAIKIALEIFDMTGKFIKPGVSEKQVADYMQAEVKRRGLELSWEEDQCPSVFTGPDTAGAHAGPTDRLVEKGHVINIDFGVKYNGYCSDLQRVWYILRDGETEAPQAVKRGFKVLTESIAQAKAAIKPGVHGCNVDDAARNYITANGFEEYKHGLGHQVGKVCHDGGCGLFPRWERYGELPFLPIEKDQVFTIEPRLPVAGHGVVTIEDMVQVTDNGCEYISNPQTELMLI